MSEQWSEWYEWNGGKCPVPNDAEVHVVFRCGIEKIRLANELRWSHNVGAYFYFHGDIIRYRVKLPQKAVVDKLAIMETALRVISMMDKDAREKLEECAELLRGIVVQYGDLGRIAATLVLSELVDEDNAKDQS